MRLDRRDRAAIEDIDRLLRISVDLRNLFPTAARMADEVHLSTSIEGPSSRSGSSYSDPTANTALDGRRQKRRSSMRKARKDVGAALRNIQAAHFQIVKALEGE